MKSIGIVSNIENTGRFVLPAEVRHALGIYSNDLVELYIENDHICIQKYKAACIFCGNMKYVFDYNGHKICNYCLFEIQKIRPLKKSGSNYN